MSLVELSFSFLLPLMGEWSHNWVLVGLVSFFFPLNSSRIIVTTPTSPFISACLPGPPWTVVGWRCRWGWGQSSWCSSRPACRCQVYRWGSWPGRLARPLCLSRTCSLKTLHARWTRRCLCLTASPPVSHSGNLNIQRKERGGEGDRESESDYRLEEADRLRGKKCALLLNTVLHLCRSLHQVGDFSLCLRVWEAFGL